jgi:site-specific recombinase XerD
LRINTPLADEYIESLKREKRAASSIRRDIAAASSFYTFLEKKYGKAANPFRGTRARPSPRQGAKKITIPSQSEINVISAQVPPLERALIMMIVHCGLKVSLLSSVRINGNEFSAQSRGTELTGTVPTEVLRLIQQAKLNPEQPFACLGDNAIKLRVLCHTRRLFREQSIKAAYSSQDFRHFFATSEYRKDRNIQRLSALLGHTKLAITESYIKGLNEQV